MVQRIGGKYAPQEYNEDSDREDDWADEEAEPQRPTTSHTVREVQSPAIDEAQAVLTRNMVADTDMPKSDRRLSIQSLYAGSSSTENNREKALQDRASRRVIVDMDKAMDDKIFASLTNAVLKYQCHRPQKVKKRPKIEVEKFRTFPSPNKSVTHYKTANEMKMESWHLAKSRNNYIDKKSSSRLRGKKKQPVSPLPRSMRSGTPRRTAKDEYSAAEVSLLVQTLMVAIEKRRKRMAKELDYSLPNAIDQTLWEEVALDSTDNRTLQNIQENAHFSSDNILRRCVERTAARIIQRAWRTFKGQVPKYDFAKFARARLVIARVFKAYRAKKVAKAKLQQKIKWKQMQFSSGEDSDSTSNDEDVEEEEEDDDPGRFIMLPRKAYACQYIQAMWRGYLARQRITPWYEMVRAAQICIARHWRGEMGRLRCKQLRKPQFQRLLVEDAVEETWESQLERIREEALNSSKKPLRFKFTSPEKERLNRAKKKAFDQRELFTGVNAMVYRLGKGWDEKKLSAMY